MNPSFGKRIQNSDHQETSQDVSLWSILNSRLVVVLLALFLWPVCAALTSGIAMQLGINQVVKSVTSSVVRPINSMSAKQDKQLKEAVAIMEKISISDLSFAPITWKNQVKIIGKLTNTSHKMVKSLHLKVTSSQNGKLTNVSDQWLSKIKLLKPGASDSFHFTLRYGKDEKKPTTLPHVKVSDLKIVE